MKKLLALLCLVLLTLSACAPAEEAPPAEDPAPAEETPAEETPSEEAATPAEQPPGTIAVTDQNNMVAYVPENL